MKLTSYRKRFEAFDELVTGAARAETIGSGATISRDTVQRMESLQLEVKESLSVIEDLQGKLDAIVKYAKPLEGTSDENVQQSLAELEATQNKQAMEKQAEAVEQVRQEYETKLAQMAAETERILQEARLQKLLKDREAALEEARKEAEFAAKQAEERIARMEQEAAAELAAQKRKREKEQLEKDFSADRARIERILAPFLNPGKSVPGPPNQWGRQAEPKPMSFSVIEGRGALENSEAGYQAFMWLAGSTENDRNNGSYPTYIGGTVNRSLLDSILEAQQLLRKYGPLLVEKELLLK
jgi:DNA repair exonuclease SbcCD ATPase subunit